MNINEWVIISNFNLSKRDKSYFFVLQCPYESLMFPLSSFIQLHFHTISIQILHTLYCNHTFSFFNVLMNPLCFLYHHLSNYIFILFLYKSSIHCTVIILSSIHYYNTVSFITIKLLLLLCISITIQLSNTL